MKARIIQNENGTFKFVDESGNDLEIDVYPIGSSEPIHICFKTDMKDWEVYDTIRQYGLEIID